MIRELMRSERGKRFTILKIDQTPSIAAITR